jgi:hypothetical protein
VAKELAWKASKAGRPRGFESHVLRQMNTSVLIKQKPIEIYGFLLFLLLGNRFVNELKMCRIIQTKTIDI